jgi:hypothetical protein
MQPSHWFQFVSYAILALFLGIILYVVAIAYSRHSGSTGLDMAAIQKIRYNSLPHHSNSSLPP